MAKTIRADEKNFPGGFEENGELLPCHFSKEEAKTYDFLQDASHKGHPFIDDDTQLRSYAPLGELIKEKEFRDMFLGVDQEWDQGDEGSPVSEDLHHMHAEGQNAIEEIPWSDAPGDKDPEIKKLAKKGKGGDSIIVMMPENVIYFFGVMNDGEISINPLTNFPQFGKGFFKEVIRGGLTVLGAVVGGAPGSAIGNYVGQRLTGRNHKQAVGHGVKAGLTHFAIANAANMMGGQGGMPNMMGNVMNMFGGGQGGGGVDNRSLMNMPGGVQSGGTHKPGITSWVDQNGRNMMPQGGGQQSNQGGGNLLSSFFQSPMVPAGLNIFSSIMARNADKEKYKNELAARRDEERRNDERIEAYKQKSGFYNPLKIYDSAERRWDHDKGRYLYKGDSDYELPRAHYAHGGHVVEYKDVENGRLIKGIGDGTSDSIYSKVPPDTFILNAFTISSLGNGSSEAGEEAIQEWFKKIEKHFGSHTVQKYLKKNNSNKMVDVALSVDEIPIFPSHVAMIGYGDLEAGIKDLEHLQKAVKAHRMKPTKGALPEESHTIESYLKGGRE